MRLGRMRYLVTIGIILAAAILLTPHLTGCGLFCQQRSTGYDLEGGVIDPSSNPLARVSVELLIHHADGLIHRDWSYTNESGQLIDTPIHTGVWSDCGLLGPTNAEKEPPPLATHVTLTLSGARWNRTVFVEVSEDDVTRNEDDVIESVDLGDVVVDPQEPPACAVIREPPLTLLTNPTLDDLVGTYHPWNTLAAANLLVREDGTFTWDWCNCDSAIVVSGSVVVEADATYLTGPEETLRFLSANYQEELKVEVVEVARVAVQVTDEGALRTLADGAEFPLALLEWLPGRVCPVCVDDAGAIALEECCCFACPGADAIDGVAGCEPE